MSSPTARHANSPTDLQLLLAARERGTPFLAWHDDAQRLELLALEAQDAWLIGRRKNAAVRLGWDKRVSREHARMLRVDGGWDLRALDSATNGTWVNERRIRSSTRLRHGDLLRIGRTFLAFESDDADDVTETTIDDKAGLPTFTDDLDRGIVLALVRDLLLEDRPFLPTNAEIARDLGSRVNTVKARLREMYASAGMTEGHRDWKRAELVRRVVRERVLSAADYE